MERICANRAPKFYEAGMDLKLSSDPYESYQLFQSRVINEYQKMVCEFGLVQINAADSIHSKQTQIRNLLKEILAQKGIEVIGS
jgi:dTMP kinase